MCTKKTSLVLLHWNFPICPVIINDGTFCSREDQEHVRMDSDPCFLSSVITFSNFQGAFHDNEASKVGQGSKRTLVLKNFNVRDNKS